MSDWRVEEAARSLEDLRRLRQDPSPEALRTFLSDRRGTQEMYDTRDAVWRRQTPQEGP